MRIVKAIAAILVAPLMIQAGPLPAHAAQSGATAKRFSACLVTDAGGLNDQSFNQLTWGGLRAAAGADHAIAVKFASSTSTEDYTRFIAAFIRKKCSLIVTVGLLMASATVTEAKAHPHQKFAIVDCTYRGKCLPGRRLKNIEQIAFDVAQDAFLGGYLAAGMSKTGAVAAYGGEQIGTVTIYLDGFWDGVRYYDSHHHAHVKVLGWNEKTQRGTFLQSFLNVAEAERITRYFIKEGADDIFPVAGHAGIGTARAVKTADAAGKRATVEWSDTDGCFSADRFCKYFLTSVTKTIHTAVKAIVLAAAQGHYRTEYIGTLANGGVSLAPYHAFGFLIPAALARALKTVKAKIESGKIVPATKGQF